MKLFITGATGYIGSSLAAHLIKKGHTVYGLYRNVAKEADLRRLGIIPVLGDLDDVATLTDYARIADAIINTADSDHRRAVETIISAIKGTGKVFIHSSGSSVVSDDVLGEVENPNLYNEETLFRPMDVRQERVNINNDVRIAGITKGIRTIVMVPSMIYGDSLGLPVESDQLPKVFKKSRELGAGVYLGQGINRWSNVHIADLVELYELALEKAPSASYYYVENGEASYKELAEYVSDVLGYNGKTVSWNGTEAIAELGDWARFAWGSNSRVNALHARRLLGWQPNQLSIREWILAKK